MEEEHFQEGEKHALNRFFVCCCLFLCLLSWKTTPSSPCRPLLTSSPPHPSTRTHTHTYLAFFFISPPPRFFRPLP